MQRSITIDIGNTAAKIGLFESNALVEAHVYQSNNHSQLIQRVKKFEPLHGIISNVGPSNNLLLKSLKKETKLLQLSARTRLPFRIEYESTTLGQDRIALAAAGHTEFRKHNVLVISAGTCITYNFISHQGVFSGGAISPGLHMRLKAMHHYTARLPEVKTIDNKISLTGNSTKSSLMSGAVNGAAFEIDGFIDAYKQTHKNLKVIITGGDLPRFEPRLKNKIFARPNAALHGLHAILQHNLGAI